MSLNCKFSGLNSKASANFKVKKAREPLGGSKYFGWKWTVLFFMWILVVVIGFIWVSYGSKYGPLRGEVVTKLSLGKAPILQHFNVSGEQLHVLISSFFETDQITSFKCTKLSRYEKPICTLKLPGPGFDKQNGWVTENIEPKDQCFVQEENIRTKFDLSRQKDNALSFILQPTSSSISSNCHSCEENIEKEHWKSISFCLVNVFLGVLIGMAMGCQLPGLRERNQTQQLLFQQQPLSQQYQQQQLIQLKLLQQAQSSPRSAGKWRNKLLIMFVLAGVTGSVWLLWHLNDDISFRRKETLANVCDERARMLQDQFNVSMNHVHALAILVSTFHQGKHPSAIDQVVFWYS
ncbi:hypothetical protein LguiA_016867 [Lonicera macranthoides]